MSVRSLMGTLLTFMTLASSRCVFSQSANNGGDQQQQLVQIEQKWLNAETGNDPDTLQTILADDFIHVLPDGFITKKEHIDFRRSHPSRHDDKRFENLKVRIFGSTAVVTGIVAANPGDGSIHETAFTDVFVYRDGRWQAVNAQETPMIESSNPTANSVASLPPN